MNLFIQLPLFAKQTQIFSINFRQEKCMLFPFPCQQLNRHLVLLAMSYVLLGISIGFQTLKELVGLSIMYFQPYKMNTQH